MNKMLKTLTNKLPLRVGSCSSLVFNKPMSDDLLAQLLDNIDIVESYVFDYN